MSDKLAEIVAGAIAGMDPEFRDDGEQLWPRVVRVVVDAIRANSDSTVEYRAVIDGDDGELGHFTMNSRWQAARVVAGERESGVRAWAEVKTTLLLVGGWQSVELSGDE